MSELIVGAGLERVRWTAWYSRNKWCLRCLLKQALSRQRKYGRADYSRPGMQWMKKILKWPLMFSAMVQIWLWKRKTRSDREGVYFGRIWTRYKGCWWCSTLIAVVAILNLIRSSQGASAGRPELAWCGSTENFVQQLEQGYVFWTNWRRARFDADVPARRELQ